MAVRYSAVIVRVIIPFALAVATLSSCKGSRGGDWSSSESPPNVTPEHASGAHPSQAQSAPDATPRVVLHPAGADPVTVRVEVQRTEQQRERGLMFRQTLDELAGMIFVFPRPEHQVFWMHNTYLPLDMIFITTDHRVLGVVENATPMTDDQRQVPGESQYVLEVKAGFAQRHHITRDSAVDFVNVPPAAE